MTCVRNAPLDGRVVLHGNVSAIREFAKECDCLAKQVTADGHRKILEEIAETWRMLAADADNKR